MVSGEPSAPAVSFSSSTNVPEEQMTAEFPPDAAADDPAPDLANDEAFARLEKEMSEMKNAIGNLSDQIADAATDIGAVAQNQARRGLKNARSHVNSMVSDASDRVGAVASAAQTQASSIGDTLQDIIEERPLSTVALALGLGISDRRDLASIVLDRIVADWRRSAAAQMRLIALAAAAVIAAAAALSFLCAAVFVFVMERYSVLDACVIVAVIFVAIALALSAVYVSAQSRARRMTTARRNARPSLLADPFVVATGVQIVQAVGVKRVATLLAVAGTAMVLASKASSRPRRGSAKTAAPATRS